MDLVEVSILIGLGSVLLTRGSGWILISSCSSGSLNPDHVADPTSCIRTGTIDRVKLLSRKR